MVDTINSQREWQREEEDEGDEGRLHVNHDEPVKQQEKERGLKS